MSALQLANERLHLEAGIDFQKSPGFIPHLRERILACAPCVGLLCIARHLAQTHIFARCSLANASLGRCRCYGYILFHDQLEKKKDLLIGNHLGRGLAGTIRPSTPRNTLSPILFLFVAVVLSKCRQTYAARIPGEARRNIVSHLDAVLDATLEAQQEARRDMIELGRWYPQIGEFMKMPGVGPVGAHVFDAFIQTPHRFATKPLALLQAGHCGPQHSGQAAGV